MNRTVVGDALPKLTKLSESCDECCVVSAFRDASASASASVGVPLKSEKSCIDRF